ncbi:MAG: phosphate/phosphite/phosphonate ABC transporter substrate-binding protein [Deltaproteobacteria bacterium]|nr:phosphate/phosphite/phosphonate ABC transporter substrate-binding protein [Deltaproteobacteria bacterium]
MQKVISIQALSCIFPVIAASLFACQSSTETPEKFSPTVIWEKHSVQAQAAAQKSIQFGIGPWDAHEHTKLYIGPLLQYLEEETGHHFMLNISENYDELLSNFQNGHIDIAHLSANLYTELLKQSPGTSHYLATVSELVNNTMTGHYRGVIFTHKKDNVENLTSLKGKTFAFVDQGSSSGFKYPLALLIDNGIEPQRDFSEIFYVGNHEAVAKAIATGQVFAGAIWEQGLANAEATLGKVFNPIAKTPQIPREAWVGQSSMSPEFLESIQAALVRLTPESRLKSGEKVFGETAPFQGYVVKSESFYNVDGKTTATVDRYLEKYPIQ